MAIYSQLPIYKVAYDLLSVATDYVQNMPRPFKAAIGGRMRDLCVEVVLLIFKANLFESANSYFGLLRQATHSHNDRKRLAAAMRRRGYRVNRNLSKTYLRSGAP